MELMCYLLHLLSSLSWSLDVAEVVVVIVDVILEENMAHLKEGVVPIVVDRLLVTRGPGNVSIARGIITSLRSIKKILVALNGHNWLMLILLPLVILPTFILLLQLLTLVLLALPLLLYHMRSMIGCASSSSPRIIIQRLMHPLQV